MEANQFDFVIVGTGLAGLYAALHASQFGRVAVLTKTTLTLSSSYWAQGGIAAAIDPNDSPQLHFEDTIKAGRNLCNEAAVEIMVKEGKSRVEELISMGMPFDKDNGKIALGLEGGHSMRRVLHSGGDATGEELVKFVHRFVKKNKNIRILENHYVYRLIIREEECFGVHAYDIKNQEPRVIRGNSTIIASGGGSAVYSRSTNPHTSIGEGIPLAFNAGAQIESMEFLQFHPTSFYSVTGETFLISEAVRGEGAYLIDQSGKRFLEEQNTTELSPRDVVSEAIIKEMEKSRTQKVFLDLRHLNSEKIKKRFSNIYREALKFGIDITKDTVPVAPAAHFMIGGIKTGLSGETNINRLYAIGETASTGVHGANRLASNSLLECLVFGKRSVEHALNSSRQNSIHNYPEEKTNFFVEEENKNNFSIASEEIADLLWRNAGIIRNGKTLKTALHKLDSYISITNSDDEEYYGFRKMCLIVLAQLIVKSALIREESRGCHLRNDFTAEEKKFQKTIVMQKGNEPKFVDI